MVGLNGMKNKKDEFKNEEIHSSEKAEFERPLPGIITATEAGPLRGTANNPKAMPQKRKDSS